MSKDNRQAGGGVWRAATEAKCGKQAGPAGRALSIAEGVWVLFRGRREAVRRSKWLPFISLSGTGHPLQCLNIVAGFRELKRKWTRKVERDLSVGSDLSNVISVFQRRRSAEDELAMRGFLQEGDLISVSCTLHASIFMLSVELGDGLRAYVSDRRNVIFAGIWA